MNYLQAREAATRIIPKNRILIRYHENGNEFLEIQFRKPTKEDRALRKTGTINWDMCVEQKILDYRSYYRNRKGEICSSPKRVTVFNSISKLRFEHFLINQLRIFDETA